MNQKKIAVRAFAKGILEDIKGYLPPEYADMECRLEECGKMNGVKKIGICFRMPGQTISPVIYMEDFYDDVRNGKPLAEIKRAVADAVMERGGTERAVMADIPITDFDTAKKYLSIRLVNTKANRAMLSAMPHKNVEDLSMFFTLNFKDRKDPNQIRSINVTNGLMEQWGIDRGELYHAAMQNVSQKERPVIKNMVEVIAGLIADMESENIPKGWESSMPEPGMPLILTNREGIYGASAMLYPGVMEQLNDLLPQGFYILPSSTHEVLILPRDEMDTDVENPEKTEQPAGAGIENSFSEEKEKMSGQDTQSLADVIAYAVNAEKTRQGSEGTGMGDEKGRMTADEISDERTELMQQ